MSTPAPVFTCTFTVDGFLRGSSGIGIRESAWLPGRVERPHLWPETTKVDSQGTCCFVLKLAAIYHQSHANHQHEIGVVVHPDLIAVGPADFDSVSRECGYLGIVLKDRIVEPLVLIETK